MNLQRRSSDPPPEAREGEREESSHGGSGQSRGWVRLRDLPPLPRVSKSHVISASHRYQGSLSSLKLRVRLLEYDPLRKKDDSLSVVEDRIFSWQEKVDCDGESGKCRLHSYVDVDSFTVKKSAIVIQRKSVPTKTTTTEELEVWEDVEGDKVFSSKEPKMTPDDSDEKVKKADRHASKEKKHEQEVLLRTLKKREEEEQRLAIVDDLLRHDTASTQGLLSKHLRSKRPVSSVSTFLLPDASKTDTRKPSSGENERKSSKGLLLTFSRRTRTVEERRQRRQMSLPSQSMVIMVTIPECVRRLVVCHLKALPTAGVITVKAPFGFRVIHATKTRVFRLSWELHLPTSKLSPLPELRERSRQHFAPSVKKSFSTLDGTSSWNDISFKTAEHNEIRIFLMGEILTAQGFESEPLCVHFLLETGQGWTNHSPNQGTTHSSYTTLEGCAHFSHHFSADLSFSMDALHDIHQTVKSPLLLVMVLSLKESGGIRYEGYGYANIPFTPGAHTLRLLTWKLRHRSIVDKMQDLFMDATPSLHMNAAHAPANDWSLVGNRLGLSTEPSGEVVIRLHLTHQSPTSIRNQAPKLELLEKMSSATIIKSVQKVIDAFNRARNKSPIFGTLSN